AVREPLAAARYAGEGTALLDSLLKAGALTAEQASARNEGFRRGLFAAAIQAQPAAAAVARLKAGAYDAALDDPSLKYFLLTQAGWRLQSEQAQGAAAAAAAVERARRGVVASPELSTRMARLLEAGALAD